MTEKLAYSIAEAAHALSISVRSIRYLLRIGRLSYVRLGRHVIIRHADLEALLCRHAVKAVAGMDAEAPIRPVPKNGAAAEVTLSSSMMTE